MFRLFRPSARRSAPAAPRFRFRPRVEALETRDTPSTTVLSVSPSPATVGQAITLTATVTKGAGDTVQPGRGDTQTGTVTFFDGSAQLGSPVTVTPSTDNTQGTAQLTTSALGAGSHSLTASYSGDVFNPMGTFFVTTGSTSSPVPEVVDLSGNVSGFVTVTPKKHATPTLEHVTLENTAPGNIAGPVFLIVEGLPRRVKLRHATGTSTVQAPGDPFIEVIAEQLATGERLPFTLHFANPKGVKLHLTFEVFAGPSTV